MTCISDEVSVSITFSRVVEGVEVVVVEDELDSSILYWSDSGSIFISYMGGDMHMSSIIV